ncbi:phospholipase A [Erwinia amylovora]|uniref:Phospholipase A1 n=3 Tax=Erwinia amylovora TaxID=552 RepID=A0A830ZYB4_ERWAM|nr:phospholipase A [Erwinia amylovora]CDK13817.1 outer membrane phospholipase A [Erwinia amylovora LA635]CDK17184.1 outer membrane phospholipase A [Erwinia amylovora LA636]CDK20553.1 outer membrane phospholipase A [Erwinia amylovora LA637]ATZ10164.1 phospholipase A [Erwinia amylovora]EKV55620.1 outer membrane phospholipase A [Erwinia amylovora ACW56400]
MALLKGLSATTLLLPTLVMAQEASIKEVHDSTAVPGSIIANLLEKHDNPFVMYPYESNYLLYTDTSNLNKEAIQSYSWSDKAKHDEVKFQLSLAFPLWRGIVGDNSVLAASYTQKSWWQLSNRGASSPFRETDYEPQIFLGWATDYRFAGWTLRDVETGFNHQSNGRSEPTSRSWNRVYARLMAENGHWLVEVKPWYRIPESENNDDNPDITRYMGYYRLTVGYQWGDSIFSLKSNYNWNSGYGGAELGWSYPLTEHVRFYTQVFSGYGESLIDYNHRQTRVGVGVTLNDLF